MRGFETLPRSGPFIVVGNRSGGATPPDFPILATAWWRQRGVGEPLYGLVESVFAELPWVRAPLAKCGALEDLGAAEAVLRDGGIVVTYPGGDHEAFRPLRERNRIDLDGKTGFVKLALRTGVPIVPAVTHGVQDSVIVLWRGERLVRLMPALRLWRLKVMPVVLGAPWGVSFGLPTFPLPAKATVQLGPPIDISVENGPDAANDLPFVQACYARIVRTMQETLDGLDAERGNRRWPLSLARL
ncbi:MAG: 1-acyl-sn-glycerol-3-phosphate acyltransferase [Actinomycetota bacterium]